MFQHILLTLALILLAFAPAKAQTPDPLPYRINRHLYFARYAEAQTEAHKALQERSTQPESKEYAVALSLSGLVHWTYARYGKADTALTAAASLFERNGMTADSNYLKTLAWQAGLCRDLDQYPRAKEVLKKGLAAADACGNGPHGDFKSEVLQEYASLDADLCHFGDAKLHYQQLIAFKEKRYGKKAQQTAISLINYANFLKGSISQYKEAETLLLRAQKILKPLADQYPQEYADVLGGLGHLYGYGIPRHRESAQYLDDAVQFIKQHLGDMHPQYARYLSILANNYIYNTPYFFKADTLFRQALAIYTHHFGEQYPNRIGRMQDIAGWYGSLGRHKDATEQRKTAYELCLRMYGPEHTSTAALMLSVANDLQQEGKRLEADTLIDKAVAVYKAQFGTLHASYLSALNSKVDLWQWQGRYASADSLLTDMLNRKRELYGQNSPEWFGGIYGLITHDIFYGNRLKCDSLIRMSETYYRKIGWENNAAFWNVLDLKNYYLKREKRLPDALLVSLELQNLAEKNFGKENYWYLTRLRGVIGIRTNLKEFDKVEMLLAEYDKIAQKIYGAVSSARSNYLTDLGNLYSESKSESDVLKVREEQAALEEQLGGSGQLYVSNLCLLASSYSDFGRYEAAKQLLVKAEEYAKNTFGVNDRSYSFLLWMASNTYSNMEDYEAATRAMESYKKVLSNLGAFQDDEKETYLRSMGFIEAERGNYKEAEKYYLQWGNMEKRHLDFGYYNLYGILLTNSERYAEADSMLKIGLKIQIEADEDRDFFYNNLSLNQNQLGNYQRSLQYMEKSMKEARRRLGEDNPKFATNLGNYGSALCAMDRFADAESYYIQAIQLIAKTKGRDNANFALKLNNYGVFLLQKGQYQEAIDTFLLAKQILDGKKDPDPNVYFTILNNLRRCYQDVGKLKEAEQLSLQIIDFWKIRSPQSAQHGSALRGYGEFCRSIGQNERAIDLFLQMKEIYERVYGPNSPRIMEALSQIGKTQIEQEQYDAAIRTYQECRQRDSVNVGMLHSFYAFDLHHLGKCNYLKGNYPAAETHLLHSIQIKEKVYDNPNNAIGQSYAILSSVYEAQNRLPAAETACRKAIQILAASAGEKSDNYLNARKQLGNILAKQQRLAEAQVELDSSFAGYRSKIRGAFSYFSTVQQQSLIAKDNLLAFCPEYTGSVPPTFWGGMAYDNALLFKGVALQNSRTLREKIAGDTTLTTLYKAWLDANNDMYAQYRLRIAERANMDSLQTIADGFEKQLAQRSEDYKTYLQSFDMRWQDVQKHLKPEEAVIEFVRYNRKKAGGADDFWYAAVVLLPEAGKVPQFVPLCAEKDLDTIFQDNKERSPQVMATKYEIPYGTTRGGGDAKQVGSSLYTKIWHPIDELIRQEAKHVYFSPDGLLHRVNFGLLGFYDEKGTKKRLFDVYTLTQLGSTRELAPISKPFTNNSGAALYVGNIDYGKTLSAPVDSTRGDFYGPLHDAAEKMKQTAAIFPLKIPVITIEGKRATEGNVLGTLRSAQAPKVVLFDTHGFFLPVPIEPKSDTLLKHLYWERNPMMQSGLVFAQVNEYLAKGKNVDIDSDGVLTALDFSKTNLKGTEVVILPNCNSGLGKIESVEGVFGLQRAFKLAGARYVLMSLWEVPDKHIQNFTDEFLRQWLTGDGKTTVPDAFRTTQKKLRTNDTGGVGTWGAMILIE